MGHASDVLPQASVPKTLPKGVFLAGMRGRPEILGMEHPLTVLRSQQGVGMKVGVPQFSHPSPKFPCQDGGPGVGSTD